MEKSMTEHEKGIFVERAAEIYIKYYLSHEDHQRQFESNLCALRHFLNSYAFERAGPVATYRAIGLEALDSVITEEFEEIQKDWPGRVWKKCEDIRNNRENIESLNDRIFPLNPDVSDGGKTSVLVLMGPQNMIGPNIAVWCRECFADGQTQKAFDALRKVRGISDKIASFYLRDIAYLSFDEHELEDMTRTDLLQPVDIWVERVVKLISGERKTLSKTRKYIDDLLPTTCSALKFNMGAWILGSQIAGDIETLETILGGDMTPIKEKADHMEELAKAYRKIVN